jgi:hypothetical protein
MILSAKNNNFIVRFNQGFFYPSIVKKYETYIKRLPIPYETLHDYMTASVQAMTFPSLTADPVEQLVNDNMYSSRGGFYFEKYLTRDFNITFKLYEGYINYWVMFDLFQEFYSSAANTPKDKLNTKKSPFLPDVTITFLDQTGFEFVAVELNEILLTSLSEVELNYSSNTAEFKTFNANFKYNYIAIKKRLD